MIPVTVFGQSQKNPFVFFDEPGEVTNFKEFKVFQSLWEGYALAHALSDASLFDLIIIFCIENRIYDLFTVNAILFDHDQPLLGN